MADNYIGWKMFDTVTIVSRPITKKKLKSKNILTCKSASIRLKRDMSMIVRTDRGKEQGLIHV